MSGDKELCINKQCKNSDAKTVNKKTLFSVTRVVGYYSRIAHWNTSQQQIYKDRKKAEENYADFSKEGLGWLYAPSGNGKLIITQFGKHDCQYCEALQKNVKENIEKLGIGESVDFKVNYLDERDPKALAEAALYSVPFDSVPTLVIAGKHGFWKKTNTYAGDCEDGACTTNINFSKTSDFITSKEVETEINTRIAEYI